MEEQAGYMDQKANPMLRSKVITLTMDVLGLEVILNKGFIHNKKRSHLTPTPDSYLCLHIPLLA